jgi:hypothetical protein
MKLIEKPINVVESDKFESVSFGIKQSGLPYIFNILRNQLYSNKPLAVLREIACNAQDANIEANSKRSIEVKLPTKLDPTLTIRDFGNGLSADDIKNLYCFYGESTKRNNNSAIGYYGIGKFAPFSYGDNFVLISFHKGVKTTYNAFIDETKIGKIVKLKEEKSSEPSGVMISVPIREDDTQIFLNTAINLFKHFKNKPVIKGASKDELAKIYNRKPVFEGKNWRYYAEKGDYYSRSNSFAVMGVGYDIDTSDVDFKDDDLESLCNQGFEVDFELGELDITASRESLEYTDKTKKAIKAKFKKVKQEIAESISNQFKNSDNIYDVKALYQEVFGTYGSLGYIVRSSLNNKIQWNGKVINDQVLPFGQTIIKKIETGDIVVRFYQKSRRSSKLVSEAENSRFVCEKSHKVLINDTGSNQGVTFRLATLWNQLGDEIDGAYVVTTKTDADKNTFDKELGLVEKNYLKLSDYEKISIQQVSSGKSSVAPKNPKHSSQIFKFKRDDARNWGTKSSHWETMSIDLANDKAIYVELNTFQAVAKNGTDLIGNGSFKDTLEKYEELTGDKIKEVYGIKSKTFESKKKVISKNKNLVNLWEYMEGNLREEFDKTAQLVIDSKHWQDHIKEDDGDEFSDLAERINKHSSISNNNSEFAQYLSAVMFYKKSNFKKVNEVLQFLKEAEFDIKFKDVQPTYDLIKLVKAVKEKYSMLNIFLPCVNMWQIDSKTKIEKIAEYINLIDKN